MKSYNSSDWYWLVGNNTSRVWSSARRSYVSADDQEYVLWFDEGGFPTPIRDESELCQVLNSAIIAEIEALELKQARPLRDIALANTGGSPSPLERLQLLEDEISTQRALLLSVPLEA